MKQRIWRRGQFHQWAPALLIAALVLLFAGCQTMQPIYTVPSLDLDRFMGDWYVIASIPTIFEKGAYNGLENYQRAGDRRVNITFTFNKDGFQGPEKKITSKGFVMEDSGNAHWGVQFIWPFKAEYRIIWLDEAYQLTVIGRTKRDYVWIMARTPTLDDAVYQQVLDFLKTEGYDIDRIQKVPQLAGQPS